jgi:hypothetical protein
MDFWMLAISDNGLYITQGRNSCSAVWDLFRILKAYGRPFDRRLHDEGKASAGVC